MPRFSVIIPVYNAAPYLRECLDSLLAQTYGNWEAVCVDDGSNDGSERLLDEYSLKDARIKVLHKNNEGAGSARNLALDKSVGEWVCFLDGDDSVDKDWLNNYSKLIERYDPSYIHIEHHDWHGEPIEKIVLQNGSALVISDKNKAVEWLWSHIPNRGFISDYAVKRSIVSDLRFPIGVSYAEDALFAVGFLHRIKNICVSEYDGYFYRQVDSTASKQSFRWEERALYVEEWMRIRERIHDEIGDNKQILGSVRDGEQSMLNNIFFAWLTRPKKWISKKSGKDAFRKLAWLIDPKSVKARWRLLFAIFRNFGVLFPLQISHALAIWAVKMCGRPQNKGLNVVICSHHISYNMGGLASITRLTAREFSKRGYRVKILTNCYDGKFIVPRCAICLNPSPWTSFASILCADYVVCEGAIFRLCWPLLFLPKKCIVVRHMPRPSRISALRHYMEKWLSLNAVWAGVSRFVAEREQIKTVVVPNACDPTIFYDDGRLKKYDLIFVGAIHSYKGVDLLFDALELLVSRGISINRLTMVGEGEMVVELKNRLKNGKIGECEVVFTGNLDAKGVAEGLRDAKVIIVPTRREKLLEAFGCVAIEGAACGCIVVASDNGGLPEATGPCGVIFKSDDCKSLADAIEKVVTKGFRRDIGAVSAHLRKYTPENLVNTYLNLLNKNAK